MEMSLSLKPQSFEIEFQFSHMMMESFSCVLDQSYRPDSSIPTSNPSIREFLPIFRNKVQCHYKLLLNYHRVDISVWEESLLVGW
ncbi:hypothetical protein GDO81_006581 [Engystomops pustulosus]|uniref:Uncharacterized protein n=1 Tax=Engystomops pustulosus TaxID=76066 RepID=A0AAV7CXR8_ENGPU|nr:hypothetical protein GDO81_006581 [Engystomops pustulosus]